MNTTLTTALRSARRWAALCTLAASLCGAAGAQTAAPIPAADAQRDLRLLERAFDELHPGLLRYADKATLAAEFDSARAAVAGGSSTGQMFLLASKLAAAVRCGHTWTNPSNQPAAVGAAVFDGSDKLPLRLRFVAGRMLVTGSAVPGLTAGAELLAIDGRSGDDLQRGLLPYLRADGGSANDGTRWSRLDHGPNGGAMDSLFPLLFAPRDGRYTLRVLDRGAATPRELQVAATSTAAREQSIAAPAPPREWTLAIDGDTAVLTLPTFAYWRGGFDARAFIVRSFATLAERGVKFLVVDNRPNEGGDDALGHALLAALIRAPLAVPGGRRESAYERVPYVLARYLDTWDFGFFDRTGQVQKVEGTAADGTPARNWRLADSPPRVIAPAAIPGTPFAGRVLMLIGPQNSSAGYLIAREAKAAGAAVLIGQATGGNLRGLNGGQLAWLTLPASRVAVDIPLVAHFAPGSPPDAGVAPDIEVMPSFDDAAAGIDGDMLAARAQIARWRAGQP